MTHHYTRRRVLVLELAPARPGCFPSDRQWTEFLAAAAEEQTTNVPGPLDLRKAVAEFNFSFDFCRDCTAKFALAMQSMNRCNPRHLKDIEPVAPVLEKQ